MRRTLWMMMGLSVVVAGCTQSLGIDSRVYTCATDGDCGAGYVCAETASYPERVCVAGAPDATTDATVPDGSDALVPDANADGSSPSDTPVSDASGSLCGGVLVDLDSDPNHCGTCDAACGTDEVCVNAVCVGGTSAVQLRVGRSSACVRYGSGAVYCWGKNDRGQTGEGSTTDRSTAQLLSGGFVATDLAMGRDHGCIITNTDSIACWGEDVAGETSAASPGNQLVPIELTLGGGRVPATICAGDELSCAAATDETVWCWGQDLLGELGCDGCGDTNTPVQVVGLPPASEVVCGGHHACALATDGSVYCWGDNTDGQVGVSGGSGPFPTAQPVLLAGQPLQAQSLAAGEDITLAVVGTDLYMWGRNDHDQLGSDIGNQSQPILVESNVARVNGGSRLACAVRTDGSLICWGRNNHGQIGVDSNICDPCSATEVFPAGSGVVEVAVGSNHTCALDATGAVTCWGDDGNGRLGCNDCGDSAAPVAVQGLP